MTINPEVPFLDGKGELATPTVLSQIDARTKVTMRADLPALAKELKIGGVDEGVLQSVRDTAEAAKTTSDSASREAKTAHALAKSVADGAGMGPGGVTDGAVASVVLQSDTQARAAVIDTVTDPAVTLPASTRLDPDELVADHGAAPLPLPLPAYSGIDGQAVHPDVIRIPGGFGPQGFEWWMGITPYPHQTEKYEQPSILASHDGETWVVPDGVTNPIFYPSSMESAGGFWPDPDLTFDPVKRRLYYVIAGVRVKWSDDGVTWLPGGANSTLTLFPQQSGEITPTVVRESATRYRMWTIVSDSTRINPILHRSGKDLESAWDPTATECTFTPPPGKEPWHMDVVRMNGQYVALIACCDVGTSGTNTALYLATSTDGFAWERAQEPLLAPVQGTWYSTNVYRASLLPSDGRGGTLGDIWYSAREQRDTPAPNPGNDTSGKPLRYDRYSNWWVGHTTLRWADPALTMRAPLHAVAEHTNTVRAVAQTVNLSPNPSMLLQHPSNSLIPAGTTNNLAGASGYGWDGARQAFTFSLSTTTPRALDFQNFAVSPGEVYTWTFYADADRAGRADAVVIAYAADGSLVRTFQPASALTTLTPGRPRRARQTITVPDGAAKLTFAMRVVGATAEPTRWYLSRTQIEKASQPSEWTPGVPVQVAARAGQDGPLTEWLSPVDAASGQRVVAEVTTAGVMRPARVPTAGLPAPATATGGVAYDTTRGALVYSDGTAWVSLSPLAPRTYRTVTSGNTSVGPTDSVVILAGSPAAYLATNAPAGFVVTLKNTGASPVNVYASGGTGTIDGTTKHVLAAGAAVRLMCLSSTEWITL